MSMLPPAGSDAFALLNIIADPEKSQARLKELVEMQQSASQQMDALREEQRQFETHKTDFIKEKEKAEAELKAQQDITYNAHIVLRTRTDAAEVLGTQAQEKFNQYHKLIEEKLPLLDKREGELARKDAALNVRETQIKTEEARLSKLKANLDSYVSQVKAIVPNF